MAMGFRAEDNPLYHIWKRNFSFTYWDNRIGKLSRYNSEDRLDSLYVLMQLSDLYAHLFTVEVRNPDQPWFMVTEKTYMNQIRDTLEKLEVDDPEQGPTIYVSNLQNEPEGLISFDLVEEDANVTKRDAIARDLLGARAPYNKETKELEYDVDPDLYLAMVNATLNFWKGNKALLNDLKHGFRVLPFDAETVDHLHKQGFFPEQQEVVDEFKSLLHEKEEQGWGITIARLETDSEDDRYEVTVHIHYVDSEMCLRMAELVQRQLFNLFYPHQALSVEEEAAHLVALAGEEPNELEVIEYLGSFEIFYDPTASVKEAS